MVQNAAAKSEDVFSMRTRCWPGFANNVFVGKVGVVLRSGQRRVRDREGCARAQPSEGGRRVLVRSFEYARRARFVRSRQDGEADLSTGKLHHL